MYKKCTKKRVDIGVHLNDVYVKSALQRLTESINRRESMHELVKLFFLALQLRTIFGLRVIDNGLGPLVFGAEENIVDFALLAADRKATLPSQVQAFCLIQVSKFELCYSVHHLLVCNYGCFPN